MKLIRHLLAALILATPLFALDADEMFADPAEEARAREIGRQLRCLKCRNQSIFDSNAGIAKDLRVAVRDRMVAGDSDEEVLAFVRDRFGDYVLMKPPVEGYTYVLWLTPLALLLIGGGGLFLFLRQRGSSVSQIQVSESELEEARKILEKGNKA